MPEDTINVLTSLRTGEVSVVERGANRRTFAITKSEKIMDPEVMNAILSTPAEGEEEFVKSLGAKKLDDKALGAAVATFRLQKGTKDLVDNELFGEVAKAAGYVAKAADEDKDDEATSGKVDPKKKKANPFGKAEEIEKSLEKLEKNLTEKNEKIEKLLGDIESREFVAKARDYSFLPASSDKISSVLKSAHKAGPEFLAQIEELLGVANEAISKSDLLAAAGSNAPNMGGSDAWRQLETMADSIVQKSDAEGLTKEKAIAKSLDTVAGRSAYDEYLQNNPAQRALNARDYQ